MSDFTDIKMGLSKSEALEKELNLKRLQINSLLTITQAINDNVSAEELYEMYHSFFSWELAIKKMALYVKCEKGNWHCATSINIAKKHLDEDITPILTNIKGPNNLEDKEHPLISQFEVVIPVAHKKFPIAYVFIGGFSDEEDMYNKVQLITTITNVIAVAIENKRLFNRQIEQERFNKEMELAAEMQRLLIPQELPSNEHYELAGIYKPHFRVGGDYFDFLEFESGKMFFCIGDISGKGVSAALLMANFQANFKTLINKHRSNLHEFIKDINEAVNRITLGDKFITFFIAEYDIADRSFRYINAGHSPPVLVDDGHMHLLDKGCTLLGLSETLPNLEVGAIKLKGEAVILTFTDGLTDIRNNNGEFLAEEKLQHFVQGHYLVSATEFTERLKEHIEAFIGEEKYPDDFTVLSGRFFVPK
jgi:sigma-B regulation protein RsbU (phosphoserine phosphatase)